MEKKKLIIKIILVVILSLTVFYFSWNFLYDKILENNVRNDLIYLNKLLDSYEYGKYYLRDYKLLDENFNEIANKINVKGEALVYITKYGLNSRLENGKICAYKTSGNSEVLFYSGNCDSFDISESEIKYSQNNSQVTISGEFDYYYVGKSDVKVGTWLKKEGGDLIINLPYSGKFYIWIKNNAGVISEILSVNVECSNEDSNQINNTLIYCNGSKLNIAGYSWRVISDINGELKLLMDSKQLDLMAHCDSEINEKYCYYKSDILYKKYKWSNSEINEFLNKKIIKSFNNYKLKEYEICDVESGVKGCKDGDGCSGYLKEEIKKGSYSCDKYSKSKIRLLTYMEYNHLLNEVLDKRWVYNSKIGEFWLMNGYSGSGYSAFKVNKFGQVYLDEGVNTLLEVRPVITIYK